MLVLLPAMLLLLAKALLLFIGILGLGLFIALFAVPNEAKFPVRYSTINEGKHLFTSTQMFGSYEIIYRTYSINWGSMMFPSTELLRYQYLISINVKGKKPIV
jgi:hypothetical protein